VYEFILVFCVTIFHVRRPPPQPRVFRCWAHLQDTAAPRLSLALNEHPRFDVLSASVGPLLSLIAVAYARRALALPAWIVMTMTRLVELNIEGTVPSESMREI